MTFIDREPNEPLDPMTRRVRELIAPPPRPELIFSDPRAVPEPLEFLLDPFLPRKRLVSLVAPGGTGKGTIWRNWVAGLTRGWEPLKNQRQPVKPPVSVLIVSFEESWASDVLPGLLAAGADLQRVRHLAGVRTGTTQDDFALRDLDLLLAELHRRPHDMPALVIFDPAMELLGSAGISGFNDAEIRQALIRPARRVIEETGATVLLVMHFNKDRSQSLQGRTAGTAGLVNAVRVQISMIRHPDDKTVGVVGISKQNIGRECTLTYRVRPLSEIEMAEVLANYPTLDAVRGQRLREDLRCVDWEGVSPESIEELYQRGNTSREPTPDAAEEQQRLRAWVLDQADGVVPGDLRTRNRTGRRLFADAEAAQAFLTNLVAEGLGHWRPSRIGSSDRFIPGLSSMT